MTPRKPSPRTKSPKSDLPPPAQFQQGVSSAIAPGTRVRLPRTGRIGTALAPPWLMPRHTLVELDGGDRQWILTEILEVIP